MGIFRRRLLALGIAAPFIAAWPVRAADDVRDLVRRGIERDASGALVNVFGLVPDVADEVLLRATRSDALPDNYAPRDLVDAALRGLPVAGEQLVRALIVDDTRALLDAASSEGLDLYIGSGFRSQAYQASVFEVQVARRGDPETANRYSARPGHSQHQLGTTVDFTISFRAFRDGPAAAWLRGNAHRFGFVLPYTAAAAERTGYVDEPWHARWLGSSLASSLQSVGYQDWADLAADDAIALVRTEAGLDA